MAEHQAGLRRYLRSTSYNRRGSLFLLPRPDTRKGSNMEAKAELAFRKTYIGCSDALTGSPADLEWSQLHDQRSRLIKAMKGMLEKCEKDGRNPNDDELSAYALAERIVDTIGKEMQVREDRGDKRPTGKFTLPAGRYSSEGFTKSEGVSGGVGLRYSELFYGRRDANLSKADFKTFGEFLEVASSGKFDARMMTTGLADGGAQVPEVWSGRIVDSSIEESVCWPSCMMIPASSGIVHYPGWDSANHADGPVGSFRASWLEEAATAPKASPKMRLVTFTLKKLGIYVDASREVLEDGLSLEAQIGPTMRQSLAWSMDDSIINGSGVARPQGILAAPATIFVNRAGAGAISYTDIMNLYCRLLPSMVAGAQWIVSPSALRQLLAMVDGASHYIWVPSSSGVAQKVPGYLLGAPVYISEKAANLGTKGDLILCNLSAYGLAMRKEIILERSNAPGWSEDLMSFRVIVRFDGKPLLDRPVTPANGGSTLSAFVALDTP